MNCRHPRARISGFTLVEVLVATALMGLVVAALAAITSQWLPSWNRGFARVQQSELLEIAMQRMAADLAAAEFIPPNRQSMHPLFEGTASTIVFVRTAIGPNAGRGLEIIRIADSTDERGAVWLRSKAPFVPTLPQAAPTAPPFADPVVLIRFPYRVSFSYAGKDRVWKDTWQDATSLPRAVRISVHDAATQRLLPISTAVSLHIDTSAQCASSNATDCAGAPSNATKTSAANSPPDNTASQSR
jgi:general secretion pathway protein J